jgi:hypothetical protein
MNREHAERVYFEQVKRAVSIEAVLLARYGIELKRRGQSLKGCCPIHKGSNPTQFVVSNGLWHCFGDCKRGGSIIEFVAAMENVEARDAALMIARWFAISSGNVINQHTERRRTTMSGEKPSHKVFVVEGEGDNAFWHRAGSAWPHKDGKGLNLQIPAGMALSGRVVLREYTDDDAKEEEQQKSSRRKK